jgi:predicted Zn-dependent peptidase
MNLFWEQREFLLLGKCYKPVYIFLEMVEFNKVKLENGLTILHEKRDLPVTTVMLGTKFGAIYENEKNKGIAHVIEHLCFKGTEKRKTIDIAREVEDLGGDLNAFTGEEKTAYLVKLPSKHLAVGMEIIFDVFFNPIFPAEEIEKEKEVICEEIKMYKDNPSAHSLEGIQNNLFENPFGMGIIGTEKTVRGLSREEIMETHRRYYVPENAVLCVVGNNVFEEVVELAEKLIVVRDGEKLGEVRVEEVVKQSSEKRAGIEQVNLVLGLHYPKLTDNERYAAEVFSSILGQGMSSRLFTEVREKRGLVYGVKAELDLGRGYGSFLIWAGTSPEKKDEVIEICKKEYAKMKGLGEDELEKAKEKLIGNADVRSEESDITAKELIMQEFASKAEDYYLYKENIEKVRLEDVRALAEKSEFAEFVLGP